MSILTKDIIVNLFLLISLLFLYSLTVNIRSRYKTYTNYEQKALIIICIAGLILCYLFPVHKINGVSVDLRMIPVVIAGLYGGWIGHLATLLTTTIVVLYTTHSFPFLMIILGAAFTLFFYKFSPIYLKLRLRQKLIVASLITSICMGFILWKMGLFTFSLAIGFYYIIVIGIGISFIVYTIEFLHNHFMILHQLQRIEKMNVVSHLAASISHEIRNPLTSSRGFLQLLLESDIDNEQRLSYSRIALDELDQAETIIRDYLTFAKPASTQSESMNIQSELIRVISVVTPLANYSNVRIDLSAIEGYIFGERSKFQQCLVNILKNAIESMPNGGYIFINVRTAKEKIIIEIKDEGVGMSPAALSKLGEPYFSTKVTGTGLGMMVVYRIIESMRGTISVKSEIGKGTLFTLTFPEVSSKKSHI